MIAIKQTIISICLGFLAIQNLVAQQQISMKSADVNYNQIVVFVEMSDTEFELPLTRYSDVLNGPTPQSLSFDNYFKEVSYGSLNFKTYFPEDANGKIVTIKLPISFNEARPYDPVTNPEGDKDLSPSLCFNVARIAKLALEAIGNKIPSNVNFDQNGDGYIDFFSIYLAFKSWGQGTMCPSYATNVYDPAAPKINGASVFNVSFNTQSTSSGIIGLDYKPELGVMCHETIHTLGIWADYYRYNNSDSYSDLGKWDIMCRSAIPPQHLSAFLKQKLGWISTIPEITANGRYTLNPLNSVTSQNVAYKINTDASDDEYLVMEYRKQGTSDQFEGSIYGTGLVIYRVNTKYTGNYNYPNTEYYAFRPGVTLSSSGIIENSYFGADVGRTQFNSNTDPYPFLSDGTKINDILISNISSAGSTISFNFSRPEFYPYKPRNLKVSMQGNEVFLKWDAPSTIFNSLLGYNIYLGNSSTPLNASPINDTKYLTPYLGPNVSYSFRVTAKYQQEESEAAINIFNLIAYYPLSVDTKDDLGYNNEIILKNTPFQNGGIYCNGISWDSYAITPPINYFDFNSFTISVDFFVEEKLTQPVIVGGRNCRWLGFYLNEDGTVELHYNNIDQITGNLTYSINQWHNAQITYDGTTAKMFLDNTLACSANIQLNIDNSLCGDLDTEISSMDFSNAKVFKGFIKNIKVFNNPYTNILNISTDALSITSYTNSTKTFGITSNTSWSVSSSEEWVSPNSTIGFGDETITLTAQANTLTTSRTAFVTVSGNGVLTRTITVTQDGVPTGINKIEMDNIKVYPNPTTGLIEISIEEPLGSDYKVEVFNALGCKILSKILSNTEKSTQIDLSTFPSGMYPIVISSKNEYYVTKIIRK